MATLRALRALAPPDLDAAALRPRALRRRPPGPGRDLPHRRCSRTQAGRGWRGSPPSPRGSPPAPVGSTSCTTPAGPPRSARARPTCSPSTTSSPSSARATHGGVKRAVPERGPPAGGAGRSWHRRPERVRAELRAAALRGRPADAWSRSRTASARTDRRPPPPRTFEPATASLGPWCSTPPSPIPTRTTPPSSRRSRVVRQHHPDAVLVLTGGEGASEREVADQIDRLAAARHRCAGRAASRPPTSRACLELAVRGGRPVDRTRASACPPLEAMAAGVAVVAAGDTALPEVVGRRRGARPAGRRRRVGGGDRRPAGRRRGAGPPGRSRSAFGWSASPGRPTPRASRRCTGEAVAGA